MTTNHEPLRKGDELSLLPVRETVLFPEGIAPMTVGREGSLRLIQSLRPDDKLIAIVTQRDPQVEKPGPAEVYSVGTAARIHKVVRLPNDNLVVFVEAVRRIRVLEVVQYEPFLRVRVEPLADVLPTHPDAEFEALARFRRRPNRSCWRRSTSACG